MVRWRKILVLFGLAAAVVAGAMFYFWRLDWEEKRYEAMIAVASARYRIDPILVRAVIWRESRFRPNMLGLSQERGLMQIRPAAALEWARAEGIRDFKIEDLYQPEINILAGSWYLAKALRHWQGTDDPIPFALAEYNAGRKNALRWVDPERPKSAEAFLARIDFPSTRRYIQQIQTRYAQYRNGLLRPAWEKLLAEDPAKQSWVELLSGRQ